MLLLFIDETSDAKFPDYFGLSVAVVNTSFYRAVKTQFQEILVSNGWDPTIEFKGSYLFSATKGCTKIPVDKRIEITSQLLRLNTAEKNRRMKFYYLRAKSSDQRNDYLQFLPLLLNKALPKALQKGGKDLVSIHLDQRDDTSNQEIRKAIVPVIQKKGYTLFEDVICAKSHFETVGILYADIVGYLSARIDTISNDSQLFENISKEDLQKNGKLLKLKSSVELIRLIKKFKRYEVKMPKKSDQVAG